MKPFIYIIFFALLFLLFKAFYLDSLPSKSSQESNTTLQEENTSSEVVKPIKTEKKVLKREENNVDRFFDEMGDSIADKIKGQE